MPAAILSNGFKEWYNKGVNVQKTYFGNEVE